MIRSGKLRPFYAGGRSEEPFLEISNFLPRDHIERQRIADLFLVVSPLKPGNL